MKTYKSDGGWRLWCAVLLVSAVAAGCGGGGSGGGGGGAAPGGGGGGGIAGAPAGAILPGATCAASAGATVSTVTSSSPSNNNLAVTTSTTGVAGGGKQISATFSLAMNPATIISPALTFTVKAISSGANVAGTVTMDPTDMVATFTTTSALATSSAYTAIITQAAATTGPPAEPLGCVVAWNFTTAGGASAGLAPVSPGVLAPYGIGSAGGISTTAALTKINGDVVLDPNQTCNAVPVANDGFGFGACGGHPPTHNAGDTVVTSTFPLPNVATPVMTALNVKWNSISPASLPLATVLGCGTIGSLGAAGNAIGCSGNSTLPPGAYISATSTTIGVTGVLTLDGQGNQDATWVFQAPSAVTTATNSSIVLINGAKASNVWWYVGSAATLGVASAFEGNILAHDSITMDTGATSCGRLLSGAAGSGAFVFDGNVVSVPGNANAPAGCQ